MNTVTFDKNRVSARIHARSGLAQMALAQQVLKDSNFYAPHLEGDLIKSGVTSSTGKEVTWNTPYARRQYYFEDETSGRVNYTKEKNPYARGKWFEFAKYMHMDRWLKAVKDKFRG